MCQIVTWPESKRRTTQLDFKFSFHALGKCCRPSVMEASEDRERNDKTHIDVCIYMVVALYTL